MRGIQDRTCGKLCRLACYQSNPNFLNMVHDLEEDRGPLEHVDFSACFIDQFALRDHVPALLPHRSARLRKLNQCFLSRTLPACRFPNLDSRPLTGNSVRRAGSNFPPRSGPRLELRRGPGPDSVHSFFGSFERSSPGSGATRKIHLLWVGIFAASRWS